MDTLDTAGSSTARGLLMLSLRPRLILTTDSVSDMDTDLDTSDMDTLDTAGSSTARGLLMLSLRPRLILTTDTVSDTDTDLDTSDMPDTLDTESSMANRLHQDLSMNHRMILG